MPAPRRRPVLLRRERGQGLFIAEGIETSDELAAVAGLGVSAGQGCFLGRPSTRPQDWASWNLPAPGLPAPAKADGSAPA
jgi:EAL domain-containing protein (putative c-di-GMP-specific phosphodiesterase class I)